MQATERARSRSGTITAKGLSGRCLRRRSRSTASSDSGVAGQVVPTETLDGDDRTSRQCLLGGGERGIGVMHDARRPLEADAWATSVTCDGLCVEPPVRRIVVLRGAGVAQREAPHGRVGPVVGDPHGDGEPGSAVGAIDEGVAGATVRRVPQLGQAVVADGDVGRDEGAQGTLTGALDDVEPDARGRWARGRIDGGDPRQRGRLGDHSAQAFLDRGRWPLDLHEDALGVVADVPGQPELVGQPAHEGPETDSLHDARYPDPSPYRGLRGGVSGLSGHGVGCRRRPRVTAASRCIRPKL